MKFLYLYLLTVPVFFLIDMLWLGVVAKTFYRENLGPVLNLKTSWLPAVLFYLLFIIGVLYFAVWPALKAGDYRLALLNGALFGFFTYATYDFTNMATVANWPLKVLVVDVLWGVVLTATVALAAFFIGKWLW